MTRLPPPLASTEAAANATWPLQDAKSRFSELVRLAQRNGPQRVTLHGREVVVVVNASEFQRLQGQRTGQLLIDSLQASPAPEVELAPSRSPMPVRPVKL